MDQCTFFCHYHWVELLRFPRGEVHSPWWKSVSNKSNQNIQDSKKKKKKINNLQQQHRQVGYCVHILQTITSRDSFAARCDAFTHATWSHDVDENVRRLWKNHPHRVKDVWVTESGHFSLVPFILNWEKKSLQTKERGDRWAAERTLSFCQQQKVTFKFVWRRRKTEHGHQTLV